MSERSNHAPKQLKRKKTHEFIRTYGYYGYQVGIFQCYFIR